MPSIVKMWAQVWSSWDAKYCQTSSPGHSHSYWIVAMLKCAVLWPKVQKHYTREQQAGGGWRISAWETDLVWSKQAEAYLWKEKGQRGRMVLSMDLAVLNQSIIAGNQHKWETCLYQAQGSVLPVVNLPNSVLTILIWITFLISANSYGLLTYLFYHVSCSCGTIYSKIGNVPLEFGVLKRKLLI
jgi:hypothetical protein